MNKLPSSSGIALIASIGVVAVSMIGFTAYKYMGNNAEEERESSFISQRPSSEFILRDTDISEVDQNEKYEPTKYDLEKVKKGNSRHVKIIGGKRSKKRKRKNKSKKRNTLKK